MPCRSSRGFALLFLFILAACGTRPAAEEQAYPDWIGSPVFPEANIPTPERIALGEKLFFDPILSVDSTTSCGSCHKPEFAFADNSVTSEGIHGLAPRRNVPGLMNIAWHPLLFRDGAARSLELLTLAPLQAEDEMGLSYREAYRRMETHPYYADALAAAYPDFNPGRAFVHALAAYQRSLLSFKTAFDRYFFEGDSTALSDSEKRGWELFSSNRTACLDCHQLPMFTDFSLVNLGLHAQYEDEGHARVSRDSADWGRFLIPPLRNVALTAPYMHDGSMATLEEVVDMYAAGGRVIDQGDYAGDGRANPHKSAFVDGFPLTDAEREDLLEFLRALTDEAFVTDERFADPR